MDLKQAREEYKGIYGKYPHHKTKLETILSKIEPVKEPKQKVEVIETKKEKPKAGEAEVLESGPRMTQKFAQRKLYLVKFRGRLQEMTAPTIKALSKTKAYREDMEFPVDSDYDEAAQYNECKQC